jgi:hypothetical protein
MDWLGRLWGARKWSVAGLAPFLSGDRLWIAVVAVVVLGLGLIAAVCWLVQRMKGDEDVEIETPILTVRRGPKRPKESEKVEKDDAKT